VTEDKQCLCRNRGKPEFIAARKKINTLLEAGYDRKYIHAKLKKEGTLTMSYSTFCVHFNKFKEEREPARIGGRQPGSLLNGGPCKLKPKTEGAPVGRPAKPEPFSIVRSRPVEDLM
jgi:hypothetical protein